MSWPRPTLEDLPPMPDRPVPRVKAEGPVTVERPYEVRRRVPPKPLSWRSRVGFAVLFIGIALLAVLVAAVLAEIRVWMWGVK